jgi:hypothetical protein
VSLSVAAACRTPINSSARLEFHSLKAARRHKSERCVSKQTIDAAVAVYLFAVLAIDSSLAH